MTTILDEYNLWNQNMEFGVDRLFAYPKIIELLNRKEIQVITGIRRCGKTTLMRQCMRHLIDTGIDRKDLLFIPCDNALLGLKTIQSLHKTIEDFRKMKARRIYIFLDEIQAIKDWEKYLKSAYDSNANMKFIISGSTASFFASDVAMLLTGRHFYHKIDTMNYKEFLRLNPEGALRDYLEWGGFPEVVKAKSMTEKEALLESYLSTIIQRDIIKRNDIRKKKKLNDLLQSLLLTVGGKINIVRLSKQFEMNMRSVERYILLAEDAFLFHEVPYFSYSKRKNRHMLPKLYASDIGFTRLLSKRFEEGRSVEWAVGHLLKNPSYWSDGKHEIDFVTDEYAIQVTTAAAIPEREVKAFHEFNKKHPKKQQLLLGPQTTEKTTSYETFLMQ
ncbi:MAG: ATP-binding protein [Nanoarchaeota archaeon]